MRMSDPYLGQQDPIFPFLIQHRRKLLSATLLVFIGAFVFLQFIRLNRFEASIHCYITGDKYTRPDLILQDGHRRDVMQLVTGTEIFNLLNYAVSDEVLNHVVDSFDLVNHYEIDVDDPEDARFFALDLLLDNYVVEHTDEHVVVFSFMDHDKDLAMAVVRTIFEKAQRLNRGFYLELLDSKQKVCTDQLAYYEGQKELWADSLQQFHTTLGTDFRAVQGVFSFQQNKPLNSREREIVKVMNKTGYVLNQIAVFDERLAFYENHSYQNRIAREMILQHEPEKLREVLRGHIRYKLFNSLLWALVWAANTMLFGSFFLIILFLYGEYIRAILGFKP